MRDPGRSSVRSLRDANDPECSALFKRPDDDAPPGELYAIGMERVAYVLGEALNLPVAPVYLETFEEECGAVLSRISNEVSWYWFEKYKLTNRGLANVHVLPGCVVFDMWLANIDRRKRNLLLQPVPPSTPHQEATIWMLWLIDHGHCALWPPGKFGLDKDAPAADADLTKFLPHVNQIVLDTMPPPYRGAYVADKSGAQAALTAVSAISDDAIVEAVNAVPGAYFAESERELTVAFLQDRRDRIEELCRPVG